VLAATAVGTSDIYADRRALKTAWVSFLAAFHTATPPPDTAGEALLVSVPFLVAGSVEQARDTAW